MTGLEVSTRAKAYMKSPDKSQVRKVPRPLGPKGLGPWARAPGPGRAQGPGPWAQALGAHGPRHLADLAFFC